MLKFTSIVGYTSRGPTYIESFFTIFGQCINVLNYKYIYIYSHYSRVLNFDLETMQVGKVLGQCRSRLCAFVLKSYSQNSLSGHFRKRSAYGSFDCIKFFFMVDVLHL